MPDGRPPSVRADRDRGRRRSATRSRAANWPASPSAPAIPLLADPLSGARHGPAAIAHYDLLLRDPEFAAAHRPEFVIRVGDLPTSKPLRTWLAGLDVAQIALDPDGGVAGPRRGRRMARARAEPGRCSRGWPAVTCPRRRARLARRLARRRRRRRRRRSPPRSATSSPSRSSPAASASGWTRRDAVRRLLDADPRRRAVLARPRGPPARALQPRRQRDRRHRVLRVRRGRRRRGPGRAADRRRRARPRHRRPAGRPPPAACR